MANKEIPNYALYGDQAPAHWDNLFDFEWIPKRSRVYNWNISPHQHDTFIQILYITEGGGDVFLDGARLKAVAPCLIVIPAQTVHGFTFSEDVNGPAVTAAQRSLESLLGVANPELIALIRKPMTFALDAASGHAESLMPLFLAIEREAKNQAIGQLTAGMALLAAVSVFTARLSRVDEVPNSKPNLRKTSQLEKFRGMVDENFKKHLPVSAYSEQLGITPGQLSRLCREMLGISSLDLINARLIQEAQRELVYTGNSTKQLAYFLGFSDETYFCRFFRKHTGLSPKAFRVKAMAAMQRSDLANEPLQLPAL